jgi:succinate dehydrogenase/fumarate reductase-like Fe-S protein
VNVASLRALAYLGHRALLAHPLSRLSRRGSGLARFQANYPAEGLLPTPPEERAVRAAASACVGCGLCEPHCAVAGGPEVRALGLQAVFRLYTRSAEDLRRARSALQQCAGCAGCAAACPTGVPIARILRHLAT